MNNLLLMIAFFLLPLVMVLVGMRYAKKPPKRINRLSGYRTRRSMRNWETWSFAHMYLGDLWFKVGVPLLAVTSVISLVVFRAEESKITFWCYVVVAIQLLLMLIPVYYTEKALKERFDEKGKWHKEAKAKWDEELEKRRAREEEDPQERKERRKQEKAQSKQPEQLPAAEQSAAEPQPDGGAEQE